MNMKCILLAENGPEVERDLAPIAKAAPVAPVESKVILERCLFHELRR